MNGQLHIQYKLFSLIKMGFKDELAAIPLGGGVELCFKRKKKKRKLLNEEAHAHSKIKDPQFHLFHLSPQVHHHSPRVQALFLALILGLSGRVLEGGRDIRDLIVVFFEALIFGLFLKGANGHVIPYLDT